MPANFYTITRYYNLKQREKHYNGDEHDESPRSRNNFTIYEPPKASHPREARPLRKNKKTAAPAAYSTGDLRRFFVARTSFQLFRSASGLPNACRGDKCYPRPNTFFTIALLR
jgi:hypothetical protein